MIAVNMSPAWSIILATILGKQKADKPRILGYGIEIRRGILNRVESMFLESL